MEIPILSGDLCARCGDLLGSPAPDASKPVSSTSRTGFCRACRMVPPPFVKAVAYGPYRDSLRSVIHALKYDRMRPVARRLGGLLAVAIGQLAAEAPTEMLVVPVPLHRSKCAQRGFNQARSLAVHATAALRRTHPEMRLALASSTLMRLRATQSQAGLTSRERRINVRGVFSVSDPGAVLARHVLLIDDIFTTGATARAAAKELVRAGAASVWVATLARATRASTLHPGTTAVFEDANDDIHMAGTASTPTLSRIARPFKGQTNHEESSHSSHDQPSF
jgi:ComF family protein